uniref:Uncharacterized protein n=1 Tax=Rhizophora mucronata TaxID=61149 RepID=A0A2P2N6P1_RHIMU
MNGETLNKLDVFCVFTAKSLVYILLGSLCSELIIFPRVGYQLPS